MKKTINKMPEDTYSREAVGGSLWTGEVFGLFISGLIFDAMGPTGC
jgi:hypothetical protein